jgi:NhaP-type Na+/H+ or K+/H+ antiporter
VQKHSTKERREERLSLCNPSQGWLAFNPGWSKAMSIEAGLAIFVVLLALYGGLGARLSRWSVTMPMVFVVIGVVMGSYGLGLLPIRPGDEAVRVLTELTLAMLLFADASTLDFDRLRHDASLPLRLLGIGFPLTLAAGALVAFVLFPAQGWGFALLLAAILAPTDAALGLPIFINPNVPVRIRRALNVESGLNDGIATPFVTLFIALAVAEEGVIPTAGWLPSALTQIALAVIVGAAVGAAGGKLLDVAHRHEWTYGAPLQFAVLALALAAYLGSIALGGNGFVAAFIAGIVFGAVTHNRLAESADYTEATGTLLSLFVWTIFGAAFVVPAALLAFDWRVVSYAVLSLTLIRMLPVALALSGLRFRQDTMGVMGWFGPRGLASVIFGLLAVDELTAASKEAGLLASIVTWTILLSVLAHGFSAQPLAAWYARRLKNTPATAPELADVPEIQVRSDVLLSVTGKGV